MKHRKPKFSGHQTFVTRYGWLEKGYRFVMDGRSFSSQDAIVELGVGKNMVESIRYWIELTGITQSGFTSDFGNRLLHENTGWDPYLEDNNSFWLLHWKLCTNPDYIHAGSILFSHLRKPEFSKPEMMDAAIRVLDTQGLKSPADSILAKDIDCYLRLYAGIKRTLNRQKDDLIGSPFEELNLIHLVSDSDLYGFNIGSKGNLSPEIIGYALWDYMNRQKKLTITINEALYHECSPGLIFMLDENSLVEAVEQLANIPDWADSFGFSEAAGVSQIYCNLADGNEILDYYYKKATEE